VVRGKKSFKNKPFYHELQLRRININRPARRRRKRNGLPTPPPTNALPDGARAHYETFAAYLELGSVKDPFACCECHSCQIDIYSCLDILTHGSYPAQHLKRKALALGGVREKGLSGVSFGSARRHGDMGYALGLAQLGATHPNAKPWKGEGAGVYEIVEDHRGDTYRAVYTVKFADVVYVLHAFQKKSKSGIKTPLTDVKLIAERLKRARVDYESKGAS
jgi:phage-related protein